MPRYSQHFGGAADTPGTFDSYGSSSASSAMPQPPGRGFGAGREVGGRLQPGAQGAVGRATERVKDMFKSHGVVIFIAIALVLIVVIIVWLVATVRQASMKVVNVTDRVLRLDGASSSTALPYVYDASKLPAATGHEMTLSMWLYLADYEASDRHRVVLRRGGSADSLGSASPIIFLDRSTNRLHIAVRTNQSPPVTTLDQVLDPANKYLTAAIEYLPLQRWVQVAVCVQDAVLTVFMDGELYSVHNIGDAWGGGTMGSPRAIFSLSSSSLFIGDRMAPSRSFVSNVQYFNYALSQRDVQAAYNRGPIRSSFLSALGLTMYGVRSPIYKMSDGA